MCGAGTHAVGSPPSPQSVSRVSKKLREAAVVVGTLCVCVCCVVGCMVQMVTLSASRMAGAFGQLEAPVHGVRTGWGGGAAALRDLTGLDDAARLGKRNVLREQVEVRLL